MKSDRYVLFDPNYTSCFYPSNDGMCWGQEYSHYHSLSSIDAKNIAKSIVGMRPTIGVRVVHIEEARELQEMMDL